MATQRYRIVSGEESEIHTEPHIEGSRITVRDVYARVEGRNLSPERVAERYNLDIADVHEAWPTTIVTQRRWSRPRRDTDGLR